MQGIICNCVALYGTEESNINLQGWLESICNLFRRHGSNPDKIAIAGKGFTGRPLTLKQGIKRLLDANVDVEAIELFATVTNYDAIIFGWRLYAALNVKLKTLVFCFDNDATSFEEEHLIQIMKDQLQFFEFKYGICYQREFKKGPELYAYGMTAGLGYNDEDMREKVLISKWFHVSVDRNNFVNGLIRDVYFINVLSNEYLNNKSNDVNLLDLINSTPIGGTIKQFSDKLWIWIVEPKFITQVRELLARNDLLVS